MRARARNLSVFRRFAHTLRLGPYQVGVGFKNVVGEGLEHEWGVGFAGLGLGEGEITGVDATTGKHRGFRERGHGGDTFLHVDFETIGAVSH